MTDIKELTEEVVDWVSGALPDRGVKGTAKKLCEEVVELFEAVITEDIDEIGEEIADCMILILDIADCYYIDIPMEVRRKLEINKKRSWRVRNDSLTHDS